MMRRNLTRIVVLLSAAALVWAAACKKKTEDAQPTPEPTPAADVAAAPAELPPPETPDAAPEPTDTAAAAPELPADPAAQCEQIVRQAFDAVAPYLEQLGATAEDLEGWRAKLIESGYNKDALEACAKYTDEQRKCLLTTPRDGALFRTCQVPGNQFRGGMRMSLFEDRKLREQFKGPAVTPEESAELVKALAGKWVADAGKPGESTWEIKADGTATCTKFRDKQFTLEFRDRFNLGYKDAETGNTVFTPFYSDGTHLYFGYTSGTLPQLVAEQTKFILDAARSRYLFVDGEQCAMLYGNHGIFQTFACKWEERDGAKYFTFACSDPTKDAEPAETTWSWLLHEGVLVHPDMVVYDKQ